MPGVDPREYISPDMAVKADVVAWVGKLDAAVAELYREIDRLPGLIGKDEGGTHPKPG